MRKLPFVIASLALIAVQAAAQVRPGDCRPVFPIVDQVALPDVVAPQAAPPVAAAHRFVGIPWWIPATFGAGLVTIIATHHDHHHDTTETVSPD
jgi:hypothetical protein